MDFSQTKDSTHMAIEKIKILVAVLELLAKEHCQFSLFGHIWSGLAVLSS
jgi:hypothetical protein